MMFYEGYHFGGMHLVWWFIWMMLIFWVFATPYSLPGQKFKKETALDILQRRFASGEITKEQFHEGKNILA